jgi:RimJ/RimL family protein N-acetyltransferase
MFAGEWHSMSERWGLDLVAAVRSVLTRATTAELPPDWRGEFDDARAAGWIEERDAESPTLLAIERATGGPVGLLILFESPTGGEPGRVDVRLGYVLAESAWGRGLGSELVGGLVGWARAEPDVASITGGVAPDNVASARVLIRNGFLRSETGVDRHTYRIDVAST